MMVLFLTGSKLNSRLSSLRRGLLLLEEVVLGLRKTLYRRASSVRGRRYTGGRSLPEEEVQRGLYSVVHRHLLEEDAGGRPML
jgi:hypothetical protein